jgi:hypothetical protein
LTHALTKKGVHKIGGHLRERFYHKVTFRDLGVWKFKGTRVHYRGSNEQKVEIDRSWLPPFIGRSIPTELVLDPQERLKYRFRF